MPETLPEPSEARSGGAVPHPLPAPVVETAGSPRLVVRRPGGRRVVTDPVPGSDPAPAPEPPRHSSGENDRQLREDVPPHWG